MSPKKGALLIVDGMPPPDKLGKGKGEPGGDEAEGDDGDGEAAALASAFGDIRAALKSGGDDEAGAQALVDFVKMCQRYKGGSYKG